MQKRDMKMKKIFALIIVLSIAGFSCRKKCNIDKPKHLKPIDWENYNESYTVYWNGVKDCSESGIGDGESIKVFGWIRQCAYDKPLIDPTLFAITEEKYRTECNGAKGTILYVRPFDYDFLDSLQIKLDTNATKKCYINGKLSYNNLYSNNCCRAVPEIVIYSTDDIKFEEE
jgi:hypothetical protein